MTKAEWTDSDKEETMWEAISEEVEKGPVPAAELYQPALPSTR